MTSEEYVREYARYCQTLKVLNPFQSIVLATAIAMGLI